MKKILSLMLVFGLVLVGVVGCDGNVDDSADVNPFLETYDGKADTGYLNLRGVEVEVTLEADVQASGWRINDAPAELAQFAVTYLRKKKNFYLEILAEDATSPDRVEWLVDGQWMDAQAAANIPVEQKTHFRMRGANAVVMGSSVNDVQAGQVYQAPVPTTPYNLKSQLQEKCASHNSHLGLSDSIYWYLWNPDKSTCPESIKQTMTLTVERVLPNNPASYPEYDKLWEDNLLTVVVLFGKLDDKEDIHDDSNWRNADKFCKWLKEAGFTEEQEAPLGRRFVHHAGELTEQVDVYYPDAFHSVADHMRMHNWQKAVSEHEVVMYNGHSVLGTGYAFEQVHYPDFYQIFQVASCLSYEYYVRPVLQGKGGWENVDVVSNVTPTYYHENLPLCGALLKRLFDGFENGGQVSWQDIMLAISKKLHHARFGVSGARGNCFTPNGSVCGGSGEQGIRYENTDTVIIPDNDPNGASSVINVQDSAEIKTLSVELDITHSYVGDLEIVLEHGGVSETLWARSGGSQENIRASFETSMFEGQDVSGDWTLLLIDHARMDEGQLNEWTLVVNESGENPDPQTVTYSSQETVSIPDNDQQGITSSIKVPDDKQVADLQVELDITHTYVGDLVVQLQHNGVTEAIWNRSGGGSDDIRASFSTDSFNGQNAKGQWNLVVRDLANLDQGQLNGWSLEFVFE